MRADRLTQNLARGCTRQPPGGGPGRSFDGAVEQPPACQPMRVVALPEHSLSSIDVAAHAPGCREAPRPISVGGGRRPRWVASRPMSPTARAANTERAVGTQWRWRESKPLVGMCSRWVRALTCGDAECYIGLRRIRWPHPLTASTTAQSREPASACASLPDDATSSVNVLQ